MLPGQAFTIEWALRVLRRRWWLLAGPLFLGILGGLLVSRWRPILYRSDAVVQVVPQRIPDNYVESTVTARVEDRVSSIAQQVLSRTQLEALIVEADLYPKERRARPIDDVVTLMTKRISVTPLEAYQPVARQPAVDALRISFDYGDPRVARDVVGRLAGFFIDRNAKERGAQADQTSTFLEAQLADALARLKAQEKKLEVFRQQNSGRLPTQTQANMQGIQNAQMALQSVVESLARDRDRKMTLKLLYSDAEAGPPPAAAVPVTSPPTESPADAAFRLPAEATPRQRLEMARTALSQLQLRLSPKHPDVIRTKRVIEDLEKQVAAEDAQPSATALPNVRPDRAGSPEEMHRREKLREMRAEIDSLDRQIAFKEGEERRLRRELNMYQARLEAVPGIESEWVALTRDYETLQKSYRDLLSKSENSRIAASLEQRQIGEQFRILDPPRVPLKPASPNHLVINAVAALAGLVFGLLLVWLVEYRDSTMRSEADVLGAVDLPLLVLLPYVTTEADRRRDLKRRLALSAGAVGVSVATAALFWFLQLWNFIV